MAWLKIAFRKLGCRIHGHRLFFDCDAIYCTRCHKWQNRVTRVWE